MRLATPLLLASLVGGCSTPFIGDCTTLFASVQLVVLDSTRAPLAGLAIVDTNLRTHQGFGIRQSPFWSGSYDVFDDGEKGLVSSDGDAVKVTGTGSVGSFSSVFVFKAGDCHVSKVSGPDTVVVQ